MHPFSSLSSIASSARPGAERWLARRRGWSWSWALMVVITLGVALLMLVTPAYLVLRTAEAGQRALDLLWEGRNLQVWGNTLLLCVSVTAATTILAVPLAYLIDRTDLPGRRLWGILTPLPLVLPSYVYAYLFVSMYGPRGSLQRLLEPLLGIERLPELYGFWGAFIVLTLICYPYTYLSVRAALQNLDPSLVEAARSLGLTTWQAFWRITLPQLRPGIVAGAVLVALYTLRDFGAVMMMRYSTFTRAVYVQYQSFFDRSLAAALALQLVVITAVVLYIDWRTRGRSRYERLSVGVMRRQRRIRLGRWRWPAFGLVIGILSLALLIPTGSLGYWIWRGWMQDLGVRMVAGRPNVLDPWVLIQPAFNSLTASALAAVLTILAAVPVTIIIVRRPGRFARLIEPLTFSGYALPGVVIALAMVFFGANYLTPLYQTLPLMLLAFLILFIPQAIGTVRSSLLQMPPSVEDAARSLGERPSGVLRRVTLPLLSPGIAAGGVLVFLTCMKELPVTLILSPIGFSTLSTTVWANISEAFFARAALPTLLLLLFSSVPLALLQFRQKT